MGRRFTLRAGRYGTVVATLGALCFAPSHGSAEDAPSGLAMELGVTGGGSTYGSEETTLRYMARTSPQRVDVEPSMAYLSKIERGGPIDPISYTWVPFEWGYPNLTITVSNDGKQPQELTEAVFSLAESALDPTPVPVVIPDSYRSNARHIRISNEGWGALEDLELAFNFFSLEEQVCEGCPLKHTIRAGDVAEASNLDCSPVLNREDVGRFKQGGARAVGELRYRARTPEGKAIPMRVKFATVVWLSNEFAVGAPAPPHYQYEAHFEVAKKNYAVRVPITKTIPPKGRTTISIMIGVDKSSLHKFRLALRGPHGAVESRPVSMKLFVPRSGAQYVRGGVSTEGGQAAVRDDDD